MRYFDTRRNGQLSKSQLTIKSTCQRRKPEHFGHFMLGLTFWKPFTFQKAALNSHASKINELLLRMFCKGLGPGACIMKLSRAVIVAAW